MSDVAWSSSGTSVVCMASKKDTVAYAVGEGRGAGDGEDGGLWVG